MKKALLIFVFILALGLSACATSSGIEAIPTVSLDSNTQPATSSSSQASASAVVVPVNKVELSFPLSGAVKTVEVEAGDSVKAGDTLATLDTAILEAKVREAEANVIAEETQVAYLIRVGTSQENLDAARADVERMKALVEITKVQLAQATLTSPIAGTIASVDISPAEFANPGQIVIVMGDLSHFQVETTDLSEKDVPGIKPGQAATVYIEALDKDFSGKVVDIARVSETVGGDVVFKVTIELNDQPEGLRWGMSAEVQVEAE
jgi:RND family efflux transporter MFP subunit